MCMACVLGWTWPSGKRKLPRLKRGRGPMARRSFDVVDVTEILIHWHAGRSKSEMAQSLDVDRRTISKYVAPAGAAGESPGGAPGSAGRWAELVPEWFPEPADTTLRQAARPRVPRPPHSIHGP